MNWLKRLFGFFFKKKTEVQSDADSVSTDPVTPTDHRDEFNEEELIAVNPNTDTKEEVEEMPTPTAPEKEVAASTYEPVIFKHPFVEFDSEEIENIINTIRPIIKSFNTDSEYTHFCTTVIDIASKRLKTFAKVSDDNKTITIALTQSPMFNNMINDFVKDHIAAKFMATVKTEFVGDYDISVANGSISIHKIG